MEQQKVTQIVEALIFASEAPVNAKQLKSLLSEVEADLVGQAIEELRERYSGPANAHGIELVQVAGGYRFRTRADLSPWLRRLFQQAPLRLGKAMLEVLAIIAYRQPVTRAEIDDVRGVDSAGSVRSLLERDLIRIVGRKEMPGNPQLYGTSRRFLEVFGLKGLGELPVLEEDANDMQQQLPLQGGGDVDGEPDVEVGRDIEVQPISDETSEIEPSAPAGEDAAAENAEPPDDIASDDRQDDDE